jgi:hypothetical protein
VSEDSSTLGAAFDCSPFTLTKSESRITSQLAKKRPLLVQAAIAAVRRWHYRPFLLSGKPVQSQVDIAVDFKMPQGK